MSLFAFAWEFAEPVPSAVLGRVDEARVLEQLGDTAGASNSYQYVLEAWRSADPALQPFVAQARTGVLRTGGAQASR